MCGLSNLHCRVPPCQRHAAGVQWRKVLDFETGEYPDVQRSFVRSVAIIAATAVRERVPVASDEKARRRTGDDRLRRLHRCGYCAVACPTKRGRSFTVTRCLQRRSQRVGSGARRPRRINVATKCTFCIDRVDAAAEKD